MIGRGMRLALAAAVAAIFAGAAQAAEGTAPDCASPAECARVLAEYAIPAAPAPGAYMFGEDPRPYRPISDRLLGFGDEGVAAVLPLLEHDNPYVRHRAGGVLLRFPKIDPRHAPALMRAASDTSAYPEHALARVGTPEAAAFVWKSWLKKPDMSSNPQPLYALARFGEAAYPLIRDEMDKCRQARVVEYCKEINTLVNAMRPLPPFAIEAWETIARSPSAGMARYYAEDNLIAQRHAYGLEVLKRRLQHQVQVADAYRRPTAALGFDYNGPVESEAVSAIGAIGGYGPAAVELGPLLTPFVEARGLEKARLAAVRAMGQIGYKPGAAALIALEPEFEDNWALAYAAAESLGRIGAGEEALTRLAKGHWYRPVRNNAERALALIRTGAFARPGVENDVTRPDFYTTPTFAYLGDYEKVASACAAAASADFNPQRQRALPWPSRKTGLVTLDLYSPSDEEFQAFLARHPALDLARGRRKPRVKFIIPLGADHVVGTDIGEFGGEVILVRADGRSRILVNDNAIAAFPWGKGLLLATGLDHGGGSGSDLWMVEPGDDGPTVVRRMRLPSLPWPFRLASPRTLVVTVGQDELAITPQGRLVDPATVAGCRAR